MSEARPALRKALRALGVLGLLLAMVAIRVVTSSASELEEGDRFSGAGDLDAAIVHYRRAARWYAPGSPYVASALDRMREIALASEQEGDQARSLAAWRGIRSAIMSTRSFYVPHRERLGVANAHIAELMAAQEPPPIDSAKPREQIRVEHLELLEAMPGPSVGWTLVLLLGFAAWVGGAFAFAARALDEEDRLVRPAALRYGALIVVGFAMFVVGMALA